MTTTRTLPHDPYINAVVDALTEAGLAPEWAETHDTEIDPRRDGTTTMLSAVLTWTGSHPAVNRAELPHGMVMLWETSADTWLYAERRRSGSVEYPYELPHLTQLADPAAVTATVRELLAGREAPKTDAPRWEQAGDTRLAIIGWTHEGSEPR